MADVVKEIITPVRLDYTMIAGTAQKRFLRGLAKGRILAQRCPSCRKVLGLSHRKGFWMG